MAKPEGTQLRFSPRLGCPDFTVMQAPTSMVIGRGVWEAGVALVFWLAKNAAIVENKTVVEIGSGVGQTGIAAGILGAKQVILTDMKEVLPHLVANIELNALHIPHVHAAPLHWGHDDDIQQLNALCANTKCGWDVVIAADCCYSEGSVPLLLKTLSGLCSSSTVVIMAHDNRNEIATKLLQDALERTFSNMKRIPLKKINQLMPGNLSDPRLWSDGKPVAVVCGESMHLYVLSGFNPENDSNCVGLE